MAAPPTHRRRSTVRWSLWSPLRNGWTRKIIRVSAYAENTHLSTSLGEVSTYCQSLVDRIGFY